MGYYGRFETIKRTFEVARREFETTQRMILEMEPFKLALKEAIEEANNDRYEHILDNVVEYGCPNHDPNSGPGSDQCMDCGAYA